MSDLTNIREFVNINMTESGFVTDIEGLETDHNGCIQLYDNDGAFDDDSDLGKYPYRVLGVVNDKGEVISHGGYNLRNTDDGGLKDLGNGVVLPNIKKYPNIGYMVIVCTLNNKPDNIVDLYIKVDSERCKILHSDDIVFEDERIKDVCCWNISYVKERFKNNFWIYRKFPSDNIIYTQIGASNDNTPIVLQVIGDDTFTNMTQQEIQEALTLELHR